MHGIQVQTMLLDPANKSGESTVPRNPVLRRSAVLYLTFV